MLFGVAFRILRDRTAAEDVCQHAFTKACALDGDKIDPNRAVAWLTSVVVNESLRQRRRCRVEARGMRLVAKRDAESASNEVDSSLRERIWNCLDELPETTQTVIVLRVVQGMTGNEVKEILGVSAALVSRHLHQGMDALRIRLAEYAPKAK
jgi:RNA polymerase sigma-70 factor (ECF subfamily)